MTSWLVSEVALPAGAGRWLSPCTQLGWGHTSIQLYAPHCKKDTEDPGAHPEEDIKAGEQFGAQVLSGTAERTGLFSLENRKVRKDLNVFYSL